MKHGKQTEDIQPWIVPPTSAPKKLPASPSPSRTAPSPSAPGATTWSAAPATPFPFILLDTDLPENSAWDRSLTDHLYGGDSNYRLQQEIVLGMGGVRMLNALGHRVNVYHMNEGHAALLTLALLEAQLGGGPLNKVTELDVAAVRQKCVFTTHTPVPAGHDRFSREQAIRILGGERMARLESLGCCHENMLNMTYVALRFSRYVNGVALQHGNVSREMFPDYQIDAITNGVHAPTWVSEPFQELLDKNILHWRRDNLYLRNAIEIPLPEIVTCARPGQGNAARRSRIAHRPGAQPQGAHPRLRPPRRHLQARRPALHRSRPPARNRTIRRRPADPLRRQGPSQDEPGKALIHSVIEKAHKYSGSDLRVVYLENYDWELGALLTAGVDVWVNTPKRPYEASGTSGMKAALNGVPSLSILDGWWIEGCLEGYTGWAIEDGEDDAAEAKTSTKSSKNP
jgi:starch phosphorylase